MITKSWASPFRSGFAPLILITALISADCLTSSPFTDSKSDARKPYALLYGTVYDNQDRPVYGVKIQIRRATDKKTRWELVSNHSGEFAQRVPAGAADYVVSADVKTSKGQPKPEVRIHVDNEERRDFALHLR